jgi:hypothetical protein
MSVLKSRVAAISKPAAVQVEAKRDPDHRFAPRRKGQTPAQIYFEGTVTTIPCVIRDMSTTGARLEIKEGWDTPFMSEVSSIDRIKLVVRMDRTVYECKIIRRGSKEIGVKFVSAPKAMAVTKPVAALKPAAKPTR